MRIIILFLMFFISICHGEVVIDGSNMLKGDIEDTYINIRDRIEEHKDREVLDKVIKERVEYKNPKDKENYKKIYFGESLDVSVRERLFQGYQNFLNRFNFEKNVWDFEQNLFQIMQILPRYSNEVEEDGGFDHIKNWNDIDKILFEDKDKPTDASFGKKTEKFSKEKEDWQIGDPRPREGGGSFEYKQEDESIAARIYQIKEKLEKDLNTKPLLLERNNKMFFETTVFPPYKPKEDPVFTLNIPQIKKTLVEVDQLEMEKFVGIENFLLNSTECEKVVIPSTGTSKEMKDSLVSTCEVLRQTIFNLDIEGIDKIGNLKPYIETGYRWGEDLTNMNDHFWSFYLEVESFKMVLKNISTSTKK